MSDYARMAIASKNPDRYMLARVLAQLDEALGDGWIIMGEGNTNVSELVDIVATQIRAYFDTLDERPELRDDKEFTAREEFAGKEIAKYITRLETAARHRDTYKQILADFLMGRIDVEQAERRYAEVTVDLEMWIEKVNHGEA